MEELTEVITSAEFHPQHCNLFCYSSSKGTIKLADMRSAALCDQHAKGKVYITFFNRLQFSKKKKTHPPSRSSQRLFLLSPISNLAEMVNMFSPETT